MNINGTPYRSIWIDERNPDLVQAVDQRHLPHRFELFQIRALGDSAFAIKEMVVRGAPLIGATAAWGLYLAAKHAAAQPHPDDWLSRACQCLLETRPTAVNLAWAVERARKAIAEAKDLQEAAIAARQIAEAICEEDVVLCKSIGDHGLPLLQDISRRNPGQPVNVLTHCNAGWLATVDWGTATAPLYRAHEQGLPLHVWVDETRPRNQGAGITAWELGQHGIPHTVIVDNAGGHLMQQGKVDICLVGTDRTTRTGEVANKIGTYLKALAAKDNRVPFYVALPSPTIDWTLRDGLAEIPIEERSGDEVAYVSGLAGGAITRVRITPEDSPVANYGFDVTPGRLVTGLITERGICEASEAGLTGMFPEKAS